MISNLPLSQDATAMKCFLLYLQTYERILRVGSKGFWEKIRNFVDYKQFCISPPPAKDFLLLKQDIANSSLATVESEGLLTVETDASSGISITSSLSQNGRLVTFCSRTLSDCEKHNSAFEREDQVIKESVKKWRHFLL